MYLISQSTYELGRVLNHFYKIKPLTQVSLPVPPSMLDLLNSTHLNSLQKLGVRQSLYPLSIVVGPPGTRKTRTLASIVCAAYLDGEGVLCLGKSNVAVRRLCQEIAKGVPRDDLGLVMSKEYYKYWHEGLYKGLKRYFVTNCKRNVLCMTTSLYISYRQKGWLPHGFVGVVDGVEVMRKRSVLVLEESSQI